MPHLTIFGLVPNLALLTVMGWSFHRGPNEGMVWAFLGGLFVDLASGAPLGLSIVPLVAACLVAGYGYYRIYYGNLIVPALFALLALTVYQVSFVILLLLTGQPIDWQIGVLGVGFPLVLLHLVLMPLFYFASAWIVRLVFGPGVRLGR